MRWAIIVVVILLVTVVAVSGLAPPRLRWDVAPGLERRRVESGIWRLEGEDFSAARLAGVSLERRSLRRASGLDSDFAQASFAGADLTGVIFTRSSFNGASFGQAVLVGAMFFECDLQGADFSAADLRGTRFRYCNTTGAQFAGARIDAGTELPVGVTILPVEIQLDAHETGSTIQ